jgi:hypothetical protein
MTDANYTQFWRRLRRIDQNQRKLSHGYVTSMNHDGLLIARPRPKEVKLTWRGVAYVVVVMMAFKIFLYAQMGPLAYQEKVFAMGNGSLAEQIGAYVMVADPVTASIATALSGRGQ